MQTTELSSYVNMGDSVGVITVARVTYCAPTIHIVFVGIQGKDKEVQRPSPRIRTPSASAKRADPQGDHHGGSACQRFFISSDGVVDSMVLDLTGTTMVYRSTALTIAPKIKIEDIEERGVPLQVALSRLCVRSCGMRSSPVLRGRAPESWHRLQVGKHRLRLCDIEKNLRLAGQ